MIKNSILVSFLFLSLIGAAQSPKYQGLLWKITGNNLTTPSYLYGTMHVSNKVAFHLSDSFYNAIANVEVVALEINPEIWMETMTTDPFVADRMGNVFSARSDYSNTGFYTELFQLEQPTNKEIGIALSTELGILNSLLYRTDNYGIEFQEDTYLDLFIYQAGKKQGKQIAGLEQLGTTMRLSEYATKPETDKKKLKASKELSERHRHEIEKLLQGKNFNEVMENAYRNGDLDLLDSLSRLSGGNEAYHNYIIVHRNVGMARAMDSIMQKQALFAGIGAAHLPNTYGVINLLRTMGYSVETINDKKLNAGEEAKEKLEETFITRDFNKQISFDSSIKINLPGKLFEFPEANNTMMAAYPDMANGATYVLTRIFTFAPLYGLKEEQYLAKIDSLLFENIPGKIISKKEVVRNGVQGFEISNQTKKGDYQHYFILVKPLEIVVYKVGGKKDFVNRREVIQSFKDFGFVENTNTWNVYSPQNSAYKVSMPGAMLLEAENNAFERGFWKKTVQSFDTKLGYFLVLNRSFMDMEYIEEDTFELSQICNKFVKQFNYETITWNWGSVNGYAGYKLIAKKENMPNLHVEAFLAGDQYYLLAAQSDSSHVVRTFFNSFSLQNFRYKEAFTLRQDSNLYFSVITNIDARPKQEYEDFYYYRVEDAVDISAQEEKKSAYYYCKNTDEAIQINYTKFHKYFSVLSIDTLWERNKLEYTQEHSFYIKSEKKWEKDNSYIQELEIADTNSQRTILVRNSVHYGLMYSLVTEINAARPRSRFVEQFFNTFKPWDTIIGQSILQNKTTLFLADLLSNDSITHETAYKSFSSTQFRNNDVLSLIGAYKSEYPYNHRLQIRALFLEALGGLSHPQLLPFLEKTYHQIGDTIQFQIPILAALAKTKSLKATKLFAELITEEAPLSSYAKEVNDLFAPFFDSLALTKALFPQLLALASLPEYKSSVYSLLTSGLQAESVKPRAYKKHVDNLLWEATNELKRQKAKEGASGLDYLKSNSRNTIYGYSSNLQRLICILMPYYKSGKVQKFYTRAEILQSPAVLMDISILKQQYKIPQRSDVWETLSSSNNNKIELYQRLQAEKLTSYFPKEITQDELVYSLFAQRAFLNLEKDSLVFLQKEWLLLPQDTGFIYFYKSKTKDAQDWEYGYVGLVDTLSNEIPLSGLLFESDFGFNKFEDEQIQLNMQIRILQMANRQRYSVSDEPAFKNLQSGRSRYRF